VIGEQLRLERLLEAICFDWCFELIELFADFVVGPVMLPLRLGGQWLANVWEAAEHDTKFGGLQALAGDDVLLL
jgi:hypothetical protein